MINKKDFDIEKFWADFLAEDEDEIDEKDDVGINEDNIELFTADTNLDFQEKNIEDDSDQIKEKTDKNDSLEKQESIGSFLENSVKLRESIDNIVKDIDGLNNGDKPIMSENAIDKIIKDKSLEEDEKDVALEREYMKNLSSKEKSEVSNIQNVTQENDKEQNVNQSQVDELDSFRELEKQYQQSGKIKSKNGRDLITKIRNGFIRFKNNQKFANANKKTWIILAMFTIIIIVGIVLFVVI